MSIGLNPDRFSSGYNKLDFLSNSYVLILLRVSDYTRDFNW
jgi:hypothetical protein